jgi:hypothetical protein
MTTTQLKKRLEALEDVTKADLPRVNIFIYRLGYEENAQLEAEAVAAHPGEVIFHPR